MKHKLSFIITLWWVILLGFLGGMIIWIAPKEQRVSEEENRYLSGAPELSWQSVIDGSYMKGVEDFLADGFFARNDLIKVSSEILGIFNIRSDEEIMDVDMEQAVNEFMEDAEAKSDEGVSSEENDESQLYEHEENIDIDSEETGVSSGEYTFWVDYNNGSSRIIYDFPVENLDKSINALNAYREALPDDGELHFFQIPYGYLGNMLIQDKTGKYSGWGSNCEEYMQERAADGVYIHNGAEILEPYLLNHEPLYYTTDYHWTALGAYYGLKGIRDEMGLNSIGYDDYEYTVHISNVGHGHLDSPLDIDGKDSLELLHPLYPVFKSVKIERLTEETDIPYMYYNHNTYLAYLGGSVGPWRKIETGADTGRSCVVVTDSFGNVFTPYLFPYYDEVFVVDMRAAYYSEEAAGASVREYIEYYEIDDAYVMLSTSSSMNSPYMLNDLMKYLD